MNAPSDLPLRERLAHWVAHLEHVLPAQAPIRDFVHHNTLHGFQHLPFPDALAEAQALTGAQTYWPESRFRACLAVGRITPDDLAAALADAGVAGLDQPVVRGLTRRDVLLASLLAGNEAPPESQVAWLQCEGRLDGDALFAGCRAIVAQQPVASRLALGDWGVLAGRIGHDWTWRSLLDYLTGEDVLERVRGILQRHLAAHLDLGLAAWRNPLRRQGFFAAWRASAGQDLAWEMDELPNVRDEILNLPDDPLAVLADELPRLVSDEGLWYGYLERLSLELPGWSGMFLRRDRHRELHAVTPRRSADLEPARELHELPMIDDALRRLAGSPLAVGDLAGYFAARPDELLVRQAVHEPGLPEDLLAQAVSLVEQACHGHVAEPAWQQLAGLLRPALDARQEGALAWRLASLCRQLGLAVGDIETLGCAGLSALADCVDSLGELQRGQVWLLAYEGHYREQLFGALAANHGRQQALQQPSAQVVMCMDDREEGTRRHLEEVAPTIVTYGAAGFFGVPMYWQGLDDPQPTALCPVVVRPRHLIREWPASGAEAQAVRHAARRARRLRWRETLFQATRRQAVAGPLLSALAGLPALAALTAATLAPGAFGATLQRWREAYEGRLPGRLALAAEPDATATPESPQAGWHEAEQVAQVAAFLRMIGLTEGFAPLVLILGHGSDSRNNPHRSAYDCGACSGKHGGPNARVFAALANRPAVRAGLARQGMVIGDATWFVAAEHNTCDDSVAWYDLDAVPARFQAALDTLVGQLGEACRAHAAERCRRLASAPPRPSPWQAHRHMVGRGHDISQARPELGHATNAAALIGRREMSRGLFLDRRVFLISYDPAADDAEGHIVEGILLAAGPVGAGIALEYYFSSVDNAHFGCGSKITHNITGLFGVMEGADSDLRTGLPWQMVEIHEPMRLLVVVEQTTAVLTAIVQRQPALQELIGNAWIVVAAKDPVSGEIQRYCPCRGWLPWSGSAVLPQVGRSVEWFAGEAEALAPAIVLGGAP